MEENETPNVERPGEGSAGPIIGTIIILIVIVLGGLYFWSQRDDVVDGVDSQVESIETQSESDDVTSIEADLEATNVDGLGSELEDDSL